jgi:osmotically-inducible protein OsmY
MADDNRWRESGRGDDNRRDDRGFSGPRREPRVPEHEGRGYERQFSGDVYGGEAGREGRDWRPGQEEREGFWGRGYQGSGYQRDERRDYSREDYGASNRGGERGGSYGGSFSRTGEEGRGGQGYGWQRNEFGQEASGRSYAGNEGRGFGYGSDERSTYGGSGHGGGDRGRSGYGNRGSERGFFERASDEVSSWFGDRDAERRREQDYRGRGPKGYKRSDSRVQEDVNDRLAEDPYVDASEIEVSVSGGEVTLSGTVDSRQARRRAEDITEQVSGVSYVQNNLRVRTGGGEITAVGSTSGAGLGEQTTGTTETAGQNKRI